MGSSEGILEGTGLQEKTKVALARFVQVCCERAAALENSCSSTGGSQSAGECRGGTHGASKVHSDPLLKESWS